MTNPIFAVSGFVCLVLAACSGGGSTTSRPDGAVGSEDNNLLPAGDGGSYARVATAVVIGRSSACAIISGSAYCWGGSSVGANRPPLRVDQLKVPATAVSGDSNNHCAIVKDELLCWVDGQPTSKVAGLPSGVTAVSMGYKSDCAVAGGKAYCWGQNNLGQLGDGSKTDSDTPVQVQGLPGEVVAVGTGEYFACAMVGGDVYCWGDNNGGQLGIGTKTNNVLPAKVQSLPAGVTAIAVGLLHACALADGAVYCWGLNTHGQIGSSVTGAHPLPERIAGLDGATAISANYNTNCALADDTYCWGDLAFPNPNTQQNFSSSPVPVGLPGVATVLCAGDQSGCAIIDGTVYCWGYNYYGQLGHGTRTSSRTPVKVDFSAYF